MKTKTVLFALLLVGLLLLSACRQETDDNMLPAVVVGAKPPKHSVIAGQDNSSQTAESGAQEGTKGSY